MKYAVVILDGAADEPLACLDGKTVLESAYTPYLDQMASEGFVGLSKNVPDHLEVSSDVACMSILGYDPSAFPIGRGAIEGAALGIDLGAEDISFRLNLCTVEDGLMKSYSADNISSAQALPFKQALKGALDDETFTLYPGAGFRCNLVVAGHPELLYGSYTEAHEITGMLINDYLPQGEGTQIITDYMRRAHDVLSDYSEGTRQYASNQLSVTDVMAFWPGKKPQALEPFFHVYGLHAGMTSGVDLLNGLAKLTGMRSYHFDGVTDGPDTDYAAQGRGATEILADNDVVFVHVEAPDAEGHDGRIEGKIAAIEAIDREIIARLVAYGATHELRIMATPDHLTPCATMRHGRGEVPFVLWGPNIAHNGATRLTETQAQTRGVVFDPGYLLLKKLLN